jgi:hypothetical protein
MIDDTALLTTDTGAGDVGDSGSTDLSTLDTGAEEVEQEPLEQETQDTEGDRQESTEQKPEDKEEPELKEFGGLVSARVRGLLKQAPELGQVFNKYPAVKATFEKILRRETAFSEVWPTLAEAKTMRETFPNGQADVQELMSEAQEIRTLDKAFDDRGQDGTYPGHGELIKNFVERDKNAAIALFKRLPKEWAQIDRDSYNEIMGKVVAATFASRQFPEQLDELLEVASTLDNPQLLKGLTKLKNTVDAYFAEKPKPSEEEERLRREREEFNKDREKSTQEGRRAFHTSFVTKSKDLQRGVITNHPAIKKVMAIKSLEGKRDSIIEQIRTNCEKFLSNSPSFMNKLRAAYNSQNMSELESLQKAAWSQPWLLNRMVRQVLQKEVPAMVSNNRDAVRRRSGTPVQPKKPVVNSGDRRPAAPTGPYKDAGGAWRHKDGSRMSTAEVLSGKHLQQS